MSRDYLHEAVTYCEKVVSGDIPNSKWNVLACQRFLDDLARESDPAWPYRFDEKKATKVCKFIEALPHIKGAKAGKKIHLEPWQCWIVCNIFGFVNKETGFRRFRKAYVEIPRGNGKSLLLSAIGLYMLSADGEAGAEVYVAARSKEQTKAVFETSQAIVRKAPAVRDKLGLEVQAHAIVKPDNVSVFRSLASDSQSLDGLNIHCAITDELHAHRTREVWDVLETGCGKRDASLLIAITTAGSDMAGICYEIHTYVKKVLEKLIESEEFFGCIYTIADGMDWKSEQAWRCANPNWNVSVNSEAVRQTAKKAAQLPSSQATFLTKHLNVWSNTHSAWLDTAKIQSCIDESLHEEDFLGSPCIVGLDMADKLDLCSVTKVFEKNIDGKQHYFAFSHSWLPEEAAQTSNYAASFKGWSDAGFMTLTPGSVVDADFIEGSLIEASQQFRVKELAYDSYHATQLITHLANEGLTCVEISMNVRNISPAMKKLEELISQGRFHFNDPLLAFAISNVHVRYDFKQNIYPRKPEKTSDQKIDPAVALFLALNRTLLTQIDDDSEKSVYETRGIVRLS